MKKLGLNPYLPSWECVPDGEPHVFDGRVYIYGSHDATGGTTFCSEDYVVWSAPVDDLGNWRYEGVSYHKMQDPLNGAPYDGVLPVIDLPMGTEEAPRLLYAPDVAKGPDGRYYLYYSLDFTNVISVAVSDKPAGPFEFLDYVRTAEGEIPNVGRWFDPAILSEESGNYLYYGFAPVFRFPGMEGVIFPGSQMVKLADDMHTILTEPVCVAHGVDTAKGTGYEEHPFFEASSIRKIGDWYYFVYSSLQGNELCYGMAKTPEGPFEYKGVIVSNGDLGYRGNALPVNYTGNNHGGLVEIGDEVYIFWHRQTHGTAFSRQGCADRVYIAEDGTIEQIEITSCGLNRGPLPAKNKYETYIACHLTEKDRTKVGHVVEPGPGESVPKLPPEMPYITVDKAGYQDMISTKAGTNEEVLSVQKSDIETKIVSYEEQHKHWKPYIANMLEGTVCGFKYLAFEGNEKKISLELRGHGSMEVRLDHPEGEIAAVASNNSDSWTFVEAELKQTEGVYAVYMRIIEGRLEFASFEVE